METSRVLLNVSKAFSRHFSVESNIARKSAGALTRTIIMKKSSVSTPIMHANTLFADSNHFLKAPTRNHSTYTRSVPPKVTLLKDKQSLDDFRSIYSKVQGKYGRHKLQFPREIVWLGGAPGSGKGTNSSSVASSRGISSETIVMSSLLESDEAQAIKAQGGMVDDKLVFEVLLNELCKPQYREGVVVDGFPRTKAQTIYITELYEMLSHMGQVINYNFVMLYVDELSSIKRQLMRGDGIRKLNAIRASAGLSVLKERPTDSSEYLARKRYHMFTQELTDLMTLATRFPFYVIDANAQIDVVQRRITASLAPSSSSIGVTRTTGLARSVS
jgi:adenylate kinase